MTGFGDASEQAGPTHYTVEVRSVNNRYFKALIRLPDTLAGIEAELETQLRKKLIRGSVTLTVKARETEPPHAQRINDDALAAYLKQIDDLQTTLNTNNHAVSLDLTSLLNLPGVLVPTDTQEDAADRARPVLAKLTDQACERLLTMRSTEGAALADDLNAQAAVIHSHLDRVKLRAPLVSEDYHARLKSRIDDLIARADIHAEPKDLIHEVAVFAERADISEEINRMAGHLDQFDQFIAADDSEPSGRTLDFIAQELLREANTIASKSNDAQISRDIVVIKGAIDRIKEQVQNVE